MKVLIADDSRMNVKIIEKIIENYGFSVDIATNGKEVLTKLKESKFHLILLDIVMPDMNGFEVLEIIKKEKQWQKIPVIMISAIEDVKYIDKCLDLGAEDYVTKPVNASTLLNKIDKILLKK